MKLLYLGLFLLLMCGYFVYASSELPCETNDLQALMLRLRQLKTETETTIKELKGKVEFLEKKLDESKVSGASVAFNAYQVTDINPRKGQTMVFSTVLTNQGDAYNSTTGVFVAPRNGTYIFHSHLCTKSGKMMQFDIMVESISYATAYGYDDLTCNCHSLQAVVELKRNERVFVQWGISWDNSGTILCQGNDNRSYFSGVKTHD